MRHKLHPAGWHGKAEEADGSFHYVSYNCLYEAIFIFNALLDLMLKQENKLGSFKGKCEEISPQNQQIIYNYYDLLQLSITQTFLKCGFYRSINPEAK